MHKLTVTPRTVAGVDEAKVETVEATSGEEDLVLLVGPRAASFFVDRASNDLTELKKMSADR